MQHLAAEYDWQRMMFIDHAGDQEFEKERLGKDRLYPEVDNAFTARNLEKGT